MSAGTAVALDHEHIPTIASPRAVAVFVPAPRRADRRRVAELVCRRLGPPVAEAHDDAGSSWIVVGAATLETRGGWPADAILLEAVVPPGGSPIGALRDELDRLHPVDASARSSIREVVAGVAAPLVGAVVGFLLGFAAMLHVVGEYVS